MINLKTRIAGFVGLLALTGTTAFAQSEMKVDVPFAFHTSNATMEAGTYTITSALSSGSTPIYRIRSAETGKSILVAASTGVNRKADDRTLDAKVEFQCAGEYCVLAKIFDFTKPIGGGVFVNLKNAPRGEKFAAVIIPARP